MEKQTSTTFWATSPGVRVERHAPQLPDGVSRDQWESEKLRFQNPRIRCLLGCLNLVESVLENDYTLLHCSPQRLIEILRKVRLAAAQVRDELTPLLQAASRVPALEGALESSRASLGAVNGTALRYVNDLPAIDSEDDVRELRRILCLSMSQLHAFIQDTFVRVVAADPRSQHDIDYFLSKRFPRDVEESEWLYYSVANLGELVHESEARRTELSSLRSVIRTEEAVPAAARWGPMADYLQWLIDELAPRLQSVLKLPGIRFDEMEIVERYAASLPTECRVIAELVEISRRTSDHVKGQAGEGRSQREQAVADLITLHADFSARITELLDSLDNSLKGLSVFVPFWLHNLEGRRALILRRPGDSSEPRKEPELTQPSYGLGDDDAEDHASPSRTAPSAIR